MKCPFCGDLIEDDSLFCTSCGSRLDRDDSDAETNETMTVQLDKTEINGDVNDVDDMTEADGFVENDPVYEPVFSEDGDTALLSDGNESFEDSEYSDKSEITEPAQEEYSDGQTAVLDENESSELTNKYSDDETEILDENQIPEFAEEEALSETSNESETDETDTETLQDTPAAEKNSIPVVTVNNGKLQLAVLMLSAALLAIIGYLFIDKLITLKAASSPTTTIHIISQSENISVKPNTHTEFYVDASGTNLSYQWYVRKNGEQMWHVWKNHNDSKTAADANESWDGMQVYCMITDNNRTSVATEIITISIEK